MAFGQQYVPPPKGVNDTIRVAMTLHDGVFIPWIALYDTPVWATRIFKSDEDRKKYNRLKYNVLKVLPYAMYARNRYAKLHEDLLTAKTKKEQRQLEKECEKQIKEMFNREVKELTITQGAILIKLINRETGYTTYQLAKEMKGGLNAFFYQSVARVFGHDLKEKYDPQEDMDIENIIRTSAYYRYN